MKIFLIMLSLGVWSLSAMAQQESLIPIPPTSESLLSNDPAEDTTLGFVKPEKPSLGFGTISQSMDMKDLMKKHHDPQVKNWVDGKAFQLTGAALEKSDSTSKHFQSFVCKADKQLDSVDVSQLNHLFNDTTHFEQFDAVNSCVFAPRLGLEMTDAHGNTEVLLLDPDCASMMFSSQSADPESQVIFSLKGAKAIQQAITKLFPPAKQKPKKPATPPSKSDTTGLTQHQLPKTKP